VRRNAKQLIHIMKKCVLAVVICLSGWLACSAQEADFKDALASLDVDLATKTEVHSQADKTHKNMVMWTIALAKRNGAMFKEEAAAALDRIFAEKSDLGADEYSSVKVSELRANTARFVARVISYGEYDNESHIIVTAQSVQLTSQDLETGVKGFCPCWPFCK